MYSGKTCIDAKLWWVSSQKQLKPSGRWGKELFVGVLAVEIKVAAKEKPLGMRNGGRVGCGGSGWVGKSSSAIPPLLVGLRRGRGPAWKGHLFLEKHPKNAISWRARCGILMYLHPMKFDDVLKVDARGRSDNGGL